MDARIQNEKTWNSVWTGKASEYDHARDSWLELRRTEYIREVVARFSPDAVRVLEIGSGTGRLARRLVAGEEKWEYVGVEPQSEYVKYSRSRAAEEGLDARLRFYEGMGEGLSALKSLGTFDLALTNDVLHHVDSEAVVAEQVFQGLNPGGLWIAIEPNVFNPYVGFRQATKMGERNFWPRKFLRSATGAGFRLEHKKYIFLIPPFVHRPPSWAVTAEKWMEGFFATSGGVALCLRKPL